MQKLILMYWGTVFLMYLSQIYYPVDARLTGPQTGKRHFMWRKADIFMVIVIAWMTCFSFLRTSYNDTGTYIATFYQVISLDAGFATGAFSGFVGNPWSLLYRSLMRSITDNYHIYFLFPALFSSLAVVKLFKKYSVNPALSLLIYFSIGTYILFMTALKQCLAMIILVCALPYAIEKKYVRYYLLVLVAVKFHVHSFMFLLIPLLLEKPWGKVTWTLLFGTLFAMATYRSTLGAFLEYAASLGAEIAESEVFDGHSINAIRVLVYWIPVVLSLVFRKRLFSDSTREENLFANLSIVSAFILMIGLVEGANMYARMAAYFEIATAISLPWMINKLFNKRSAQLVTVCAAFLYFVYFWYEFAINKDFGSKYSAITLWQFIQSLVG